MKRIWLGILFAVTGVSASASASAADRVDFNRQIRPLLFNKCVRCHGPDAERREADLRLDTEAAAKGNLGAVRAIVPGQPAASALMARITSSDPAERMPPVDSGLELSAGEIELIRRWIAEGAEWSKHWAFVPPRWHPVPPVKNRDWPANWIDYFVLARLEKEKLQPSADADRVTLIRRLYFDLTGLPPAPAEVDRFVLRDDPNAYEQLVDRLLASERYGERMAMYWLDLVRYADTVGYHGDQEHNISPYRDYVIDAFNDNLAFDQFTREQLAGDLLRDAKIDQKIASGYNRLMQTSHEGGVQAKEYMAIYMADRIRNLSAVWMGATMGCCQCHDHKYDPFTMHDFYSLQAFFADVDETQHLGRGVDRTPTMRPPEIKVLSRHERLQIAALEERLEQLEAQRTGQDPNQEDRVKELQAEIARLADRRDAIQDRERLTMITVSIKPRTIRVLPRGNWLDDSGPIVLPAVPAALGRLELGDRRATRLDLGNWLTDEAGAGGLTARVMANRFWYLLFGVGIAKVLDDFGGQGEAPVHPKLLDRLAIEFMVSDWDVKHLMKRIVMSRSYRQSSLHSEPLRERDPTNRLYARQSRFRLPAELIRDNALAVSGLLVLDYGGASARPYQPAGYYRHLNFPKRTYQTHTDRRQWRRGVYVHWQRQFLHPMLMAFDAPSREECTAERPHSNTPQAAMTLLNDPTFVEAARMFAELILREGGGATDTRLDFAYRRAVLRKPSDQERTLLARLLVSNLDHYRTHVTEANSLVRTGQAPRDENLEVASLAAWTAVARAILSMNETMTRN